MSIARCRSRVLAAVVLSLAARVGEGAPGMWSTGGPYGGRASSLAISASDPAVLYAGAGTVYKSTEADLAFDPTGVTTVYAARGSVWQSSPPVPVELMTFEVE